MKPQDFDRLSAYIDNQLAPGEQAALEQRLGREPELRAALAELRLTVKAVRSLPRVKTPRNFTLTAAQVGARAGARPRRYTSLFGTLRLAATMSAVALAVVAGGDFAASRGYFGPAAAPAEDVLLTTAEDTTGAAAQAALTETPAAEMSVLAASDAPPETLVPEVAPAGDGAPSPQGTATASVAAAMAPETPTPTPSTERMAEATPAEATATDVGETATRDLFDTAEAEPTSSTKVVPPDATDSYYAGETAEAPANTAPGFPPLRLLEAALAMLTVLLGLGAWLAARNP